MKKPVMVSLVVSVGAVACAAAVEPARFQFIRDVIPPPVQTGEVASFTLDAAAFAALDARMGNLRLFDDAGSEQPSLIRQRIPVRTTTSERPFGAAAPADAFRELPDNRIEIMVTRDSRLPPACGLRLESGVRNFEKMVTVSASADGRNWTTLAAAEPIYDYSRFVDIRKDTIRFAPANFSRFRLEISNITEKKDSPLVEIIRQTRGAKDSNEVEATSFRKEPFRIERLVFIERITETARQGEPETGELALTGWTVNNDTKNRQTVIEIPTRRQPLTSLTIGTEDQNFSRAVTVEGTDDADRKVWRRAATGRIGRVRAGVIRQDDLTILFAGESRCHTYRVVIDNQDNPAIGVTSLTAKETRYETLFFPKTGMKYRAAYGGEDILPPSYDIGAVLAACPVEAASQWSLGPESPNPAFRPAGSKPPFSAKVLLPFSIAAMVVVLALLVAKLARKVGTQPPD